MWKFFFSTLSQIDFSNESLGDIIIFFSILLPSNKLLVILEEHFNMLS